MVEPPPQPPPEASSEPQQTSEPGASDRRKLAFGAQEFVDAIARRITEHLRKPELEEPLVVGVFGEWGSGKSRVLKELEGHFRQRADAAGEDQPLTLPIFFNAWRFEAEEHLVIPLLKTAEHNILAWEERRKSKGKKALGWLRHKAEILEQASIALFYGLKGKLAVPQVAEISFDPGASLEAAKERWQEIEAHKASPIQEMASLYYDFHTHLEKLTDRDNDQPRFNLVFLVDDLDRCLPEKAVQMLESIKLFLEVQGCVFVLAVDDEVVSRGISHRYRDYQRDTRAGYDSIAHSLDPKRYRDFERRRPPGLATPITGAEYLEKIIHLPFRIPRPSETSVSRFLLDRYPELFAPARGKRAELLDIRKRKGGEALLQGSQTARKSAEQGDLPDPRELERARQLLRFFRDCAPPVPRKLIRSAEMYKMLARVATERGWPKFDPLTLARVVLLQLFAPELYRFGRSWPTFLAVLEDWRKVVSPLTVAGIERFLGIEKGGGDGTKPVPDPDGQAGRGDGVDSAGLPDPAKAHLIESRDRPLLAWLRETRRNRSGFDPLDLVDESFPATDSELLRYYRLRREEPMDPLASAELAIRDTLTSIRRPSDRESFVLQITSEDPLAWRNAIESERERLQDGALDGETFGALKEHAKEHPERIHLAWLYTLESYLTGEQMRELYKASRLLQRLSDEVVEGGRPS